MDSFDSLNSSFSNSIYLSVFVIRFNLWLNYELWALIPSLLSNSIFLGEMFMTELTILSVFNEIDGIDLFPSDPWTSSIDFF